MSKYYKAEDVIRAIAEQLCWIARTEYGDKFTTEDWLEEAEDYVSDLPTIEVSEEMQERQDAIDVLNAFTKAVEGTYEDCISRLRDYQIEWLTAHCDIELEPILEQLIIRFLNDTTEMFSKEYAPSVIPSRAEGEWLLDGRCSECLQAPLTTHKTYCPNCGAKMKGVKDGTC